MGVTKKEMMAELDKCTYANKRAREYSLAVYPTVEGYEIENLLTGRCLGEFGVIDEANAFLDGYTVAHEAVQFKTGLISTEVIESQTNSLMVV